MQGYMYSQQDIDNLEISFIFDLLAIKDNDDVSSKSGNKPKRGYIDQLF